MSRDASKTPWTGSWPEDDAVQVTWYRHGGEVYSVTRDWIPRPPSVDPQAQTPLDAPEPTNT